MHFSALAAFVTLARELVKDAEDIEGDRSTGSQTVPVLLGLNVTNIAVYIVLLFTLSFAIVSLYAQRSYLSVPLSYLYYVYSGLFLILPMYKIAIDVRYAKEKSEYSRLSLWLKYVIFVGILSILFF